MEDVPEVEHEAESDDEEPEWAETVHQKAIVPKVVPEVKAPKPIIFQAPPAVNVIRTYDPDAPKPAATPA